MTQSYLFSGKVHKPLKTQQPLTLCQSGLTRHQQHSKKVNAFSFLVLKKKKKSSHKMVHLLLDFKPV